MWSAGTAKSTIQKLLFFVEYYYNHYCYGDISYHTPKMDSSKLNIFPELRSLGETTSRSLRDIWQTDCKPSTASTSFVWLPFSANTITFTYHPLFELYFHRSYLKTTTIILSFIDIQKSLSDSKSPQVSEMRLNSLANCSNAFVWVVSVLPDFQFLQYFSKPLGTVSSVSTGICIIVILIFFSFLVLLQGPCTSLSLCSLLFSRFNRNIL